MKTLLLLATAVTTFGLISPSSAQAGPYCQSSGHTRVVSYLPCGRPVYAVYQIVGYNHCGQPVGQWVTQRQACGCSVCSPRPVYGHGYHHSCPPSYRNPYYGRSSSGFRFGFGFSR
jgi:hypothetical protein